MPSDRLTELRRQRALLQEHAAWLDREIAAEEAKAKSDSGAVAPKPNDPRLPIGAVTSGAAAKPADSPKRSEPTEPSRIPAPMPSDQSLVASSLEAESEAVLQEYRVPPEDLQRNIKRGCFLYFAAALLVLALGVTALYLALKH